MALDTRLITQGQMFLYPNSKADDSPKQPLMYGVIVIPLELWEFAIDYQFEQIVYDNYSKRTHKAIRLSVPIWEYDPKFANQPWKNFTVPVYRGKVGVYTQDLRDEELRLASRVKDRGLNKWNEDLKQAQELSSLSKYGTKATKSSQDNPSQEETD